MIPGLAGIPGGEGTARFLLENYGDQIYSKPEGAPRIVISDERYNEAKRITDRRIGTLRHEVDPTDVRITRSKMRKLRDWNESEKQE